MKRSQLKRGTKPLRQTPLKMGEGRLKQGGGLRRRSKSESQKYKRRGGRIEFRAWFLGWHPGCHAGFDGCRGRSEDVHEVIPRGLGGSILPDDKAISQRQHFASLCRPCHEYITVNTAFARAEGWLASPGRIAIPLHGVSAAILRPMFESQMGVSV